MTMAESESDETLEQCISQMAADDPRLRPAARRRRSPLLPKWHWAFSALTAVLIVFFLMMTTLVGASADALPGSTLHPVKRATKDAWVRLTPARYEPELHLRLAQRRLTEIEELARQGTLDESVLEMMSVQVEDALVDVHKLPPDLALPVLEKIKTEIEHQQEALNELRDDVPVESRQRLETVLGDAGTPIIEVELLRQELRSREPAASPVATDTVSPSAVPRSNKLEGVAPTTLPTRTERPAPRPTVAPTEEPTDPPTTEPLPTRYESPAPEPTSGVTEGQEPTETRAAHSNQDAQADQDAQTHENAQAGREL